MTADRDFQEKIYFFLNFSSQKKEDLIKEIAKKLKNCSPKFAGLEMEEDIKPHLSWNIFGNQDMKKKSEFKVNKKEISVTIKQSLKKCSKFLASKGTIIFVFPCFNLFVKEKMFGVNGFTPCANTFHVFLYTQKYNKKMFQKMIAHEFNHSVFMDYHNLIYTQLTLLDSLILEGLAQNFVESLFREPGPWAKAIPLKECKEVFSRVEKSINSKDYHIYSELFFEGKKYPLWAGYSLGYQIVKSFLKIQKKISWGEIMKLSSLSILENSRLSG